MASRRLDISSLLCSEDPPNETPRSPPVNEPVLAPRLPGLLDVRSASNDSFSPKPEDPFRSPSSAALGGQEIMQAKSYHHTESVSLDKPHPHHGPHSPLKFPDQRSGGAEYYFSKRILPQETIHLSHSRVVPSDSPLQQPVSPFSRSSPSETFLDPSSMISPLMSYGDAQPSRSPSLSPQSSHIQSSPSLRSLSGTPSSAPLLHPFPKQENHSHFRSRSYPSSITINTQIPATSPLSTTPNRPPISGLDVLVHVASEERRRLSISNDGYSKRASPIDNTQGLFHPRTSYGHFGHPMHHLSPLRSPQHHHHTSVELDPNVEPSHDVKMELFSPSMQTIRELNPRPRKRRRQSDPSHEAVLETVDQHHRNLPPSPTFSMSSRNPYTIQSSSNSPGNQVANVEQLVMPKEPALEEPHTQASTEHQPSRTNDSSKSTPHTQRGPAISAQDEGSPNAPPLMEWTSQADDDEKVLISKHSRKMQSDLKLTSNSVGQSDELQGNDSIVRRDAVDLNTQPTNSVSNTTSSTPLQPRARSADVERKPSHEPSVQGVKPEQDAHEWFLEHYAETSPPHSPSPVPVDVCLDASSPEATLAALEQELGSSSTDCVEVIDAPKLDEDNDLATDVDAELLSLVDDQPLSRAQHPRVPPKPVQSSSTLSYTPSLSSPVVQKGTHPFFPSNTPDTESIPSTAETMVPLQVTTTTEQRHSPISDRGASVSATSKKKGEPTSKPKAKSVAKPRTKSRPKSILKTADRTSATPKGTSKRVPQPAVAGSKKNVQPATKPEPVVSANSVEVDGKLNLDKKDGEKQEEDDRLYCVCKTKYDENRVMIACDRCDEWYHTQCVNIRDVEVDLVDQFICPLCIANNAHLSLRTTYKKRCLNGLAQADPSRPDTCHKPSRGAFSKFCSDNCGVKYMQMRIDTWANTGGNKEKLWESVKKAEQREGVVISADQIQATKEMDAQSFNKVTIPPKVSKIQREVQRLSAQLESMGLEREDIKKQLEVILWRERLTELAAERSERLDTCGWDQRLCFGDEEWSDFGVGVLESYEEKVDDRGDGTSEGAGEWWCPGKKKCDRHAGWQKLRTAEVSFDKETKEAALVKLTNREREIRKCIEDLLPSLPPNQSPPGSFGKQRKSHALKLNGEEKKGKTR